MVKLRRRGMKVPMMMACVTQSLPIILLSWQLSTAQLCSNFILDHHALRNHVIQTLSVSSEDECFTECEDSSQCVTINLVNLLCIIFQLYLPRFAQLYVEMAEFAQADMEYES